jgi:arylsulfatase A-like enzyme
LIVRWPGLTENLDDDRRRCDGLFYNLDLGPTLCELLDVPVPESWRGESFAAVRDQPVGGRSHLILSHGAHSYQRAVRTRDHLYVPYILAASGPNGSNSSTQRKTRT